MQSLLSIVQSSSQATLVNNVLSGHRFDIDGHIHLFSNTGFLDPEDWMCDRLIGFADLEYDASTNNLKEQYIKAINKFPDVYWLVNGTSLSQIQSICEELEARDIPVRGFGELKLYDEYNGKPVGFKKISLLRDVVAFSSRHNNRPVYVHYEVTGSREARALEKVLKDFPGVPIIWCHGGMGEKNQEYAWGQCVRMAHLYSNLWIDVSWTLAKYLSSNPYKIFQLPMDRVFWGSDWSVRSEMAAASAITKEDIREWRDNLSPILAGPSNRNLRRLFAI